MTLFLQVILFSHLAKTDKKVVLFETVTSQSVRDIMGEDYAVGKYGLWDSMAKCKDNCPKDGYCIDTGRHVPNWLGMGPPWWDFKCNKMETTTTTTTSTTTYTFCVK